ncbi:triple tyrosine motif-containing protein [Algoriphagus confluentis]
MNFKPLLPDSIADFPVVRRLVSIQDEVVFVHHTGIWQYKPGWTYPKEVFTGDFMVYLLKKLASGDIVFSNNEKSGLLVKGNDGVYQIGSQPFPFPLNDFVEVSDRLWLGIDYWGKVHTYDPQEKKLSEPLPIDFPVEKGFVLKGQMVFYGLGKMLTMDMNLRVKNLERFSENIRFFTFMEESDRIWMAGPSGIYLYKDGRVFPLEPLSSLGKSQITKIFKTADGTIWMGTYQEGLFKIYDQSILRILNQGESLGYVTNLLPLPGKPESTLVVTMNSLWEYSQKEGLQSIFLPNKPWFPILEAGGITSTGVILLGGRNLLYKGDIKDLKFEKITIPGLPNTQTLRIVPLENGDILLGCQDGLFLLDSNLTIKKEYIQENLSPSNISQISFFSDDLILFGNSVDLFLWKDEVITPYDPPKVEGKVISHYPISDSKVWFGTSAGKAVLFDIQTEEVLRVVNSRMGKIVTTVGFGPDSTLLIATEMGPELLRKDGSMLVYDERVQAFEVPFNSYRFYQNGDFLLGTINDLFLIDSEYQQKEKSPPYLESFHINDQIHSLSYRKGDFADSLIHFPPDQNNFLFNVNLVEFQGGEGVMYSFKLVGFSDSWGPWQSDPTAQFTNIPSGSYSLAVRIRYDDGQIRDYKMPYIFQIEPPFWSTNLGLFLIFILFWLVFFGLLNAFEKRNIQKNRKLTALVNERTQEVLEINKNLEEIVRARTFDLEMKNLELLKTIKEKNFFQRNEQIISSHTHDIVCLIDTSFKINLISASVEAFLGIPAEQIKGKQIIEILGDEKEMQKLKSYLSDLEKDTGNPPLLIKLSHVITHEELSIEVVGNRVFSQIGQSHSGYVLNLRNVTERESLKEELIGVYKNIYRDFHDEVGNKLARIIALVSMAKLQMKEKIHFGETIEKVEHTAKNLYRDTRDFIWSLDESNNNLDELSIQIRDFGEQLFDGSSISFKYFSSGLTAVPLKPNRVRDVLLIIKELLTNVLKHSQATECTLMVRKQGSQVLFLIYDNGVGLESEKFSKGRGLKNILFRAERSQGHVVFKNNGRGTLIGIRIPL